MELPSAPVAPTAGPNLVPVRRSGFIDRVDFGERTSLHRWCRPKRIRGLTSTLRFVQPPAVESDRAKLLYSGLHALTSVYTWAT
jgi:hypothetical protein